MLIVNTVCGRSTRWISADVLATSSVFPFRKTIFNSLKNLYLQYETGSFSATHLTGELDRGVRQKRSVLTVTLCCPVRLGHSHSSWLSDRVRTQGVSPISTV